MTIGIDLTPLQTGHRFRGIGAVIINTINHLPAEARQHKFVFYNDSDNKISALKELRLEGLDYELRDVSLNNDTADSTTRLSRIPLISRLLAIVHKLRSAFRALTNTLAIWRGDRRGLDLAGIDCFIQFDQNQPLPIISGQKINVIYDFIPYILENDYLWNYHTARFNGTSVAGALYKQLQRVQYLLRNKLITRHADKIIAISEHTKLDAVRLLGTNPDKVKVVSLGISQAAVSDNSEPKRKFKGYVDSSWGPVARPVEVGGKPYLLFIGGADPRRKLEDLVAAYNNLRARGYDLQLVLVGDSMFGPSQVPNEKLRDYLLDSPYLSDIIFMGFVSEDQKNWLYEHALAFVYPSVYEGFGLPVLEAMSHGCPVICYKNSSVAEVAKQYAMYAAGWKDILRATERLLEQDVQALTKQHIIAHANTFSWTDASSRLIQELTLSS